MMKLRFFSNVAKPYAEPSAFSALYEQTHVAVYRYVYGLTGGASQDAEDITAEAFLKAWQARERFSGTQQAAMGWLFKIARRIVIDRYRKSQSHPVQADLSQFVVMASDSSPEESLVIQERTNLLWQMVQTLSDQQREMLVLRYMLGWKVKDIADYFDMKENTVSVNIRRILTHLRDNWPEGK